MDEKYCSQSGKPIIRKFPPCPLQCRSIRCRAFPSKAPVDRRPIVWVIGAPSSGKHTQCQKISGKFDFKHLIISELLQAELSSESDRAKCLSSVMQRGERPPNDLVLDLLKETIFEQAENSRGFVIEGYPREKSEGVAFEKTIGPVTTIIYLEVSSATLLKRMTGREPQTEEQKRLIIKRFHENNILVIAEYPEKIIKLNGEGTVEEIFAKVQEHLNPIVAKYAEINASYVESRL